MKTLPKYPINLVSAILLSITITSCSKNNNPAPVNTSSPPAEVYNKNTRGAYYPTTGEVFDAEGNFYLADQSTNLIKKITPTGIVTVFAGSGAIGASDGNASAASFNLPGGLAIDAAGNIYVADAANNMIRKVSPDGNVSTLAGSGSIGSANGNGKSASFNFPQGIAVDKNGNVYVSDTGNDLIRKITSDGTVSTFAGNVAIGSANGSGTKATFNIPQGLAVDSKGNVYVADAGNNYIRMITPDGTVSTFSENKFTNSVLGTVFAFPDALAIDEHDNLYITEAGANDVKGIGADGSVWKLGIDWSAPFGGKSYFINPGPLLNGISVPNGIAVDHNDQILVADYGDNRIVIADQ